MRLRPLLREQRGPESSDAKENGKKEISRRRDSHRLCIYPSCCRRDLSHRIRTGPSGKETYYNLNMDGVVSIMRGIGNDDEYWVRDDGVKMLGDYIMVAANLNIRPRGSLIETSLGTGIVCDTGTFAKRNPTQLDIAVSW